MLLCKNYCYIQYPILIFWIGNIKFILNVFKLKNLNYFVRETVYDSMRMMISFLLWFLINYCVFVYDLNLMLFIILVHKYLSPFIYFYQNYLNNRVYIIEVIIMMESKHFFNLYSFIIQYFIFFFLNFLFYSLIFLDFSKNYNF